MKQKHHNEQEVLFSGQILRLLRTDRFDNGSTYLLKLPVDDAVGPVAQARMNHEYDICRELDITGILRPTAKESVQGQPAIIFEDPGGTTLEQLLTNGPVGYPFFLDISIELADIIGRLHRKGFVHKDIHAGNIIVRTACDPVRVYLTGLGIATLLTGQSVERTAPSKLEGTPTVMSPEQTGRMNRLVDFRTDFYSLGVVLYQMLTGHLPFTGNDLLELVHAHLAIKPQAPSEVDPRIPSILSELVLKLLAKDADDRYRSGAGIVADLKRCRDDWRRTGTISPFELARQDVSESFHIPDKLYGRQDEICNLQAVFERTCSGSVKLLLVTGDAGIGKTELVNQLRRSVLQKNGYFISGKCDPLDRKIPCAPFVEAISDSVDQLLARPQERLDRVREIMAQTLGDQGRVLTDVIPVLSLIIGEQPPVPELPPDQARNRLHLMIQRLFAAVPLRGIRMVVFLDDLQWADSSTLKMLQTLACDKDLRDVLLIGAYREQEVDATHGLAHTIKKIDGAGGCIETMALGPISAKGVQTLIADALDASPSGIAVLAALCQQKTGGNPFFLKRFLLELVARKLIFFNTTLYTWQWHDDKIAQADVTDNVVELMAGTIEGLDDKVQQALKTAACIGSNFNLETLCAIHDQPSQALLDDLWPAVQSGLISMPPGPGLRFAMGTGGKAVLQVIADDVDPGKIRFYFIHDRIQEAAYGLMADDAKMEMHLRIGRLLLEECNQKHLEKKIFDVLGQLNRAVPLITKQEERDSLAELNLRAGQRAHSLALFESAFEYFRMGIDLVASEGWLRQYELTKELHLKGIEAAYVSGRHSEMDDWFETTVYHIHNPLDVVDAYIIKIEKELSEQNFHGATDIGLAILAQLGSSMSANPLEADAKAELRETSKLLSSFSTEEIDNLPEMKDPFHLAICNILHILTWPTFFSNRSLYQILACKGLRLMLCHGNSKHSAHILATYTVILAITEWELDKAIHYGRLSVRLLEHYKDPKYENRVKYLFLSLISPLFEHAAKTVEPTHATYHACLDGGHIEQAGSILFTAELVPFFIGERLAGVDGCMSESRKMLIRIQHKSMALLTEMHHQVVHNLMGRSTHTSDLIGDVFDERIYLPPMIETKNEAFLFGAYCCKLMLAYLFEQFKEADSLAEKIDNSPYMTHMPWYNSKAFCFSALARLALCKTNEVHKHSDILKKIDGNQERLQSLADTAPMNFLHQLYIVKAERARVEGSIFEAQEHFDRAIKLAEDNGYLQYQALANELAAKFWMDRDKTLIAQVYMQQALEGYTRWGAAAKVRDLQEKHPEFFIETKAGKAAVKEPRTADLDVMSALRASRAISGEIRLDRLVDKLMAVVIENAGATSGRLLLQIDDRFYVTAEAATEQPGQITRPEKAIAAEEAEHLLPLTLIQYVQRTGKSLVIEDAPAHERFGQDPYIIKNRPRSMLCSPIVRKKNLIGLFYLENSLVADAFTDKRLKMLEVLSAQIAVSLENANLYESRRRAEAALEKHRDHLEELVEERTDELKVANKELAVAKEQAEAANVSKSDFLARMSHEIRTPLNAVTGLTNIVLKSELTAKHREYLNKIQLAGNNLMNVINDILDFSKVEAGRLDLEQNPFELDQLMGQLANLFSDRVAQMDLKLQFVMTPQVPRQLIGDAGRLTQVLTNLIGNAIKFTETGEIVVGVDLDDAAPKEYTHTALKFSVSDTGVGITADTLPTLFDPFTQADGSLTRKHEGTGLGLAICRQLAELMGGRIWAESKPGKGSVFSFTVKLQTRVKRPAAETPSRLQEPSVLLIQNLTGRRVLVVEDSALNLDVAVVLLEETGLTVETAENGQVAVDKVTGSAPGFYNAVLMDIQMPVMDGNEATRKIREWERQQPETKIPIIALTAHALKGEKEKCLAAGMDDYLTKPLDEQELLHVLLKWIVS